MVVTLAKSLLAAVQSTPGICRIETQFVPFELSSLREAFLEGGFQEFERVFLRNDLATGRPTPSEPSAFQFEPWVASYTARAAALMQQAHLGSVDAEMNEMYRTQEGCRSLLDNIMAQHGCGQLVPAASYALRKPRARALSGFLLTTEISAGHAHLAQVAVSPAAQGLGLSKRLAHGKRDQPEGLIALRIDGIPRRPWVSGLQLGSSVPRISIAVTSGAPS